MESISFESIAIQISCPFSDLSDFVSARYGEVLEKLVVLGYLLSSWSVLENWGSFICCSWLKRINKTSPNVPPEQFAYFWEESLEELIQRLINFRVLRELRGSQSNPKSCIPILMPGFFFNEDRLFHWGPFVFVRLSEPYVNISASLYFLRKMLYMCVTIHLMKVCVCSLYILLNSS